MYIANNLRKIKEQIVKATDKVSRSPDSVRLVAVSKKHSSDILYEAYKEGQIIFGENYIQEANIKIEKIGVGPVWHFIGHLQTNKIKIAAKLFDTIHTVHNYKIAKFLNQSAYELNKTISILIQINIDKEAQKFGCIPSESLNLAKSIVKLSSLQLCGLMTIPPYFENPEKVRPYFVGLRELAKELAYKLPLGCMNELSMGMSNDFVVAIEEGATLIRLGTAIFGARD